MSEIVRSTKPKIFTIWPFTVKERFSNPALWFRGKGFLLFSHYKVYFLVLIKVNRTGLRGAAAV